MKPLIYLKINPKYENFEANALKNKIQELLVDQNVVYSTSLISDDYDVAHFINLDDVSYFSNNSKKDIKKVISLFYSENDIYGNILKITNKKDEKELLPYEISNYDIKILNLLDLILVPSNEAKNYLINIGITKKIEILKMPLKISNYELKNSILHKAIYSYFRLKEDSFLIVTTIKHNDIEAFKNLFVLLEKFPKATFVCISQFANKGLLNIKIKSLLKRKPKNLIFTTPLTVDLYNSLMYNAKIFLNLSSIPSSVLECYEAMASKTQIFALESSCFKDILIDKKNCYLYNNIDLLRVGIDQYLLKLIDSTTDGAFNEVKEMTISESANELINYYKVLTEEKNMLDVNYIINNKDEVKELLARKGFEADIDSLVEDLLEKRRLQRETETNKAEQNKLSKSVPEVKKAGGDVQAIFAKVKELANINKENEEKLKLIDERSHAVLIALPNLPDKDLLSGEKENNKPIFYNKEKPEFNFAIKSHVELCESLGLIDYERGVKVAGAGTWFYTGLGAQLEWALLNFFISEHLKDGFQFMLPPHLLNYDSGFTAGQFPKFEEDVFKLDLPDQFRFLLPTAETALVNYYRNEILDETELPKKFFAYTPCYRKEAGTNRAEERGMIRGYQFNKVEMVEYTKEDDSDRAFEELVAKAQSLMTKLGLHFRISKLAAGDCSHSMARTYDIEVYIPSLDIYKEVSSVSNARSYQARRGMMRYKDSEGKIHYMHTLNGSGLATSRVFPAMLEQYQNSDGSVTIPEVLRPFMGGLEVLKPIKK